MTKKNKKNHNCNQGSSSSSSVPPNRNIDAPSNSFYNALDEACADFREKCIAEGLAGVYVNAAMPLAQLQAKIRNGLIRNGTDVQRNDNDPLGDGDQSEIRGSFKKAQFYRDLFATGGDILNCTTPVNTLRLFSAAVIGGIVVVVKSMLQQADSYNANNNNNTGSLGDDGLPSPELVQLLESRETSMRLTPLLLIVSLGKNVKTRSAADNCMLEANYVQIAKLLLSYGARPDAKDVVGKTVCHYGAGTMATEMTLQVCDMCLTAAESAYMFGKQVEMQGLKNEAMNGQRGIARGFQVESGRRAVHVKDKVVAIKPENLRLVDGTKPKLVRLCDMQDRIGSISMLEVIMAERVDVAKWLLDRNVKVDAADCDGCSPLSLAMTSPAQMSSKVCQLIKEANLRSAINERRRACSFCGAKESDTVELSVCSACKVPRYCSKECQTAHWKASHKAECRKNQESRQEGVLLERPQTSMAVISHDRRASASGKYAKPSHVKAGEKFTIKVQAAGTLAAGNVLIYDKSRECMFDLNPGMQGYAQLFQVVRAETACNGLKTYMKAMFDVKGNCIAFPGETSIKTW